MICLPSKEVFSGSQMKTKNIFLVVILLILTSSLFLIMGGNQQPALQSIVSETQKHLNKLKQLKENLNQLEEKTLLVSEKHLELLGFEKKPLLFPLSLWTNTSTPAVVTYVRYNGQERQAVGLLRNIQHHLPNTTVLIYNLGLDDENIQIIQNYCDTRCMIIQFNLDLYPSHISEDISHAFRPLVIQDSLTKVGGILFLECNWRITSSLKPILKTPVSKLYRNGIIAWATRQATSSLTHPNMFGYFQTTSENFLFLPMVEVTKLLIYNTHDVHYKIMLPWVQCALTEDCISPIGAQSSGCHFNKKPQYRYSGCHGYDASALNIVLGLHFDFRDSLYTYPTDNLSQSGEQFFKSVSETDAFLEFSALEDNSTMLPGFK